MDGTVVEFPRSWLEAWFSWHWRMILEISEQRTLDSPTKTIMFVLPHTGGPSGTIRQGEFFSVLPTLDRGVKHGSRCA